MANQQPAQPDELDGSGIAHERARIGQAIREHHDLLAGDVASTLSTGISGEIDAVVWKRIAEQIVELLTIAVETGGLDMRSRHVRALHQLVPAVLTPSQLSSCVYVCERALLDELALHDTLGATSDPWPLVAQFTRRAAFDLLAAFTEGLLSTPPPGWVHDSLTTLVSRPVFDLVLAQEIHRAQRYQHPLALILFDVDNLSQINRNYGYGVGDRLLERMGILVRRFFRKHDWVSRHAEDSIAALLPQTSLDVATELADRVRGMVEARLSFRDHNTEKTVQVTLSAAVVGTEVLESEIDPYYVVSEAQEAVRRAKLSGRNRVERVTLLPTSVSLIGAARLLNVAAGVIRRLVREGQLQMTRRGRHYHIDRASLERYRMTLGRYSTAEYPPP